MKSITLLTTAILLTVTLAIYTNKVALVLGNNSTDKLKVSWSIKATPPNIPKDWVKF